MLKLLALNYTAMLNGYSEWLNISSVILDPTDFHCMYRALQNVLFCITQNKNAFKRQVYDYIICITYRYSAPIICVAIWHRPFLLQESFV